MEKYPKLLIISHNIFEETNNIGKTLVSLLNNWPKDRICQIYLRDDTPSFKHCNDYYRILDKEMIKSYYRGRKAVGTIFNANNNLELKEKKDTTEQNLYNLGNKRIPLVSLARDLVWKNHAWKNERLKNWLKEQKIDAILFVPNDYSLIFPIALFVKKFLKIPLVPYFMDDAFYYDCFVSPIDYIRRLSIRSKGKKVINGSKEIITIGPKMAETYQKHFNLPCTPLMNSVYIKRDYKQRPTNPFVLSYVGNLHSNRWKSLVEIGRTIDEMKLRIQLNIYSASFVDKKMDKGFSNTKSITFKGQVLPSDVPSVLENSSALLFVESFERKSSASTKYSLSTKIPEYLNAHRPIFAYGPKNISSMEYLKKNKLGITCSNKKDLVSSLSNLVDDHYDVDDPYTESFINEHHNIEKNREILSNIILNSLSK